MVSLSVLAEVAGIHGAPLCGAARAEDLEGNREAIRKILPGARSAVVVAAPHSRAAIESADLQVAQYDTIQAYWDAARASHAVARFLERQGHRAIAVPGFIPIDMAPPKHGMVGAVDWREAGVKAGLGGYGESGLLVTREFGPAARFGGVLTDAEIPPAGPPGETPCTHCNRCLEACPAAALPGGGRIDRKKCGEKIFAGGYRAWRKFLLELVEATPERRREMTGAQISLEIWQNFMTGNYYSCFACQAACPVGRAARA